MAFHDDLLQQARHLIHKESRKPKQASLRRAVSTAYYALFHLLVSESIANWRRPAIRKTLGRAFEHGVMKSASNRILDTSRFPFTGQNPNTVSALRGVAKAFAELQEKRHTADYDNTRFWTKTDALAAVTLAERAFLSWKSIRDERIAQEYLISLLIKSRS
jgi:uncharacterized protein (UPF0332 family)